MVDVDLPIMTSLSPEPDSPVPIPHSAKRAAKCNVYKEVSLFVCLSLSYSFRLLRETLTVFVRVYFEKSTR